VAMMCNAERLSMTLKKCGGKNEKKEGRKEEKKREELF
jgi:hypothetical protein